MKIRHITIILLLISNLVHAQLFQNSIIKTKPVRLAIALNPNLSIETQVNDSRFTLSQEFTYMLRTKESIGFEGSSYVLSNGFNTITECRFYFDKKLKYPKGHYLAGQIGFTYSLIKNQDYYNLQGYVYTANTKIRYPEFNIVVGKQVLFFDRLSLDFLVGIHTEISPLRQLYIIQSYDYKELIGTTVNRSWGTSQNLFLQFNLGIFLTKYEEK